MSVFRDLYVRNNLHVDNDLVVNGTTTTVNTKHINLEDQFMYLNNKYQSTQGVSGGIMLNYKKFSNLTDTGTAFAAPSTITTTGSGTFAAVTTITIAGATNTANNGTFTVASHVGTTLVINEATLVNEGTSSALISSGDAANTFEDTVAAGGFPTTTTIATTGAATFAAGDLIQISAVAPYQGNSANLGLYVVLTHAANVLTIDTTAPASNYAQTAFVVDTSSYVTGVTIDKIVATFIQSSDLGVWNTTSGSTVTDITNNVRTIGDSQFESITLTGANDQIIFNRNSGGDTMTIDSEPVAGDVVYSIPDVGSDANFVLSVGGVLTPGVSITDGITNHTTNTPRAIPTNGDTTIHTFTPPGGGTILNLPDAATYAGRTYKFILLDASNGDLTITCAGSDTIENGVDTTVVLDLDGQHISLTSDGTTNWKINL